MPDLKLIMIGTGEDGDPFHVDLPNYSNLRELPDEGAALVTVTNRNMPPSYPPFGPPSWVLINGIQTLVSMSPAQVTQWWAQLAQKFPSHQPPYQPAFLPTE